MNLQETFSTTDVTNMLSVSKSILDNWSSRGILNPIINPTTNNREYTQKDLDKFENAKAMFDTEWDKEYVTKPKRAYSSVELFAGAGGLALGLEKAGFDSVFLNEIDKNACETLQKNRPNWNVKKGDISKIDFTPLEGKIDFLSGGFPCQSFSYAGKSLGFEDTRGTLFFEFARAIKEIKPRVFLGENVKGLLNHDKGETIKNIKKVLTDLGYTLIEPKVLKAIFYQVPQKRERVLFIGVRNDLVEASNFKWPSPYKRILTMKDALLKGELFESDVPISKGQKYPERKKEILSKVPPGGCWRNLPIEIQKEYMLKSYYLGGGKTGMARRLSWDEPSLTLTCAPAQKQTERCHPNETRPLTIREYARIQTFPDDWEFCGALTSQYKQIGNAVPVNLAFAVGRSLIRLLNNLEKSYPVKKKKIKQYPIMNEQLELNI